MALKIGVPSLFDGRIQTVGGSVAPNSEFLLVARRGSHTWHGPRWADSVVAAPRTTHSAKPEVFMDQIEAISPGPYLEMFSRRARLGWDTWGDEALGTPRMKACLHIYDVAGCSDCIRFNQESVA